MFSMSMTHQPDNFPDFLSTQGTDKSQNHSLPVNLLVMQQMTVLAKKTSDPKRALDKMNKYMGIQMFHQTMIGRIWIMN